MKFAIITDTHIGMKNGNDLFLDHQMAFFTEQFFPYLIENKIRTVVHLGDFFDQRRFISYKAIWRVRKVLLEFLVANDIVMHIIPGNHDVYYKNTNELCSIDNVLLKHAPDNIVFHAKPNSIEFGDSFRLGLVPWICSENELECHEFIAGADVDILAGHFEIGGFNLAKNNPVLSHGMEISPFSRFDEVWSGHFHTASTKSNIRYLGTPYEMTWSDCNDPKSFYVFDTATRELEAIENPNPLFFKLYYDDSKKVSKPPKNLKSKYVRLIVVNKTNYDTFDRFVTSIETQNPHDFKIIEHSQMDINESYDENEKIGDTPTLIRDYITDYDTTLDRDRLTKCMMGFYSEAQIVDL